MNFLATYGLVTHALLLGALAGYFVSGKYRLPIIALTFAVALSSGLATATHGIFSTPSVTLVVLVFIYFLGYSTALSFRSALLLTVFLTVFYLLSMGYSAFDPYRYGYHPSLILTTLLPLAAALCWWRLNVWILILSVNLLAYSTGAFPNLWDVLFDPILFFLLLGIVGRGAAIAIRRRQEVSHLGTGS